MEKTKIIETKTGQIQGYINNNIKIFKGIPYTEPLLSNKRFLEPIPKKKWKDVLDCLEYGPDSPQPPEYIERALYGKIDRTESEQDCLTLNIWTPEIDNKKRAVMLWIHGGDFVNGGGNRLMYDGEFLAKRGNIVVVTINYRLGVLGFLDIPDTTTDSNVGLLDQVAALRWIKDNIQNFGGDSENVTIFGQSAGSRSVVSLSILPIVKELNLFQKAIAMSTPSYYASDSKKGSKEFLKELNLGTDDINADIDQLREIPIKKIIKKQAKVYKNSSRIEKTNPWIPTFEGNNHYKSILDKFKEGKASNICFMIGTTLEENKAYSVMDAKANNMTDDTLLTRMRRILKYFGQDEALAEKFISTYKKTKEENNFPKENKDIFDAINTDLWFRIISIRLAETQSLQNKDTYSYIFTWKSPAMDGKLGAAHAVDLPFVFGTLSLPKVDLFAGTNEDALILSGKIMDAWISFAKTGNPNHKNLPEWTPYDTEKRTTMILGKEVKILEDPYHNDRKLWEGIF
ncbi:MAG: carboxylesterase family protein [archaeon]|nr:carboxylesterase family protein [archaeon]